jgi:hypothetical protein
MEHTERRQMTDPIKRAIEALSLVEEYGAPTLLTGVKVRDAAIALRNIKPDCRVCSNYPRVTGSHLLACETCTNYDKFTQMQPVCLTKIA